MLLPKIRYDGNSQTVKNLIIDGKECFDLDSADGTRLYHKHQGDSTQKGGCYTIPVKHTHNNSCYKTDGSGWYHSGSGAMNSCSTCGGNYQSITFSCRYCGYSKTGIESLCTCGAHKRVLIGDHSCRHLACGKNANTIDSYSLSCGFDAE